MSPSYAAALGYIARNWPVLPVSGKIPLTKRGVKDASTDRQIVKSFWFEHPGAGVAIATGNGLGVLDVDPRNDGDNGFESLLAGRKLPDTPMALTGGGGRHYYFSIPTGLHLPTSHDLGFPGVDWQGIAAYVVAPPSIHPNGKPYVWEESSRPGDVNLAQIPDWLIDVIKKPLKPQVTASIPEKIREGGRHEWLTRMAGKLRWQNFGQAAILSALLAENESGRFDPPVERKEIERIASDYALKAAGPERTTADHNGHTSISPSATPPERASSLALAVSDLLINPEKRTKGFLTGLADLDEMTGGLYPGEVTILGARTAMGKSSLALRIAENVSCDHHVLYFTVEMVKAQVVNNLVVGLAKINSLRARRGKLHAEEVSRIPPAVASILKMNLFIDDTPGLTVVSLGDRARKFVAENPDTLLVVDYLQIVSPSGARVFSRQEQVAEVSAKLLQLARELSVPVLAMAQLNREVDNRTEHWPVLADLRESGSIEHDAACVLLLHRPGMYDNTNQKDRSESIVQVVKNRHGPPGHFKLHFSEENMRFESIVSSPARTTEDGREEVDI